MYHGNRILVINAASISFPGHEITHTTYEKLYFDTDTTVNFSYAIKCMYETFIHPES